MPRKKNSKGSKAKSKGRSQHMKELNAKRKQSKNGGTAATTTSRRIQFVYNPPPISVPKKITFVNGQKKKTSSINSILNKTTNDLGSIQSLLNKPVVRRKAPVTRRTTTTTSKKLPGIENFGVNKNQVANDAAKMLGAAGNTLNAAAKVVKNTTGKRGRPTGVQNGQGKIREMKRYNTSASGKYMIKKATTKSGQKIYILNDFSTDPPRQYQTTPGGIRNRVTVVLRATPVKDQSNCYYTLFDYNLRPIFPNKVSGPTIIEWASKELYDFRKAHPRKSKNK